MGGKTPLAPIRAESRNTMIAFLSAMIADPIHQLLECGVDTRNAVYKALPESAKISTAMKYQFSSAFVAPGIYWGRKVNMPVASRVLPRARRAPNCNHE